MNQGKIKRIIKMLAQSTNDSCVLDAAGRALGYLLSIGLVSLGIIYKLVFVCVYSWKKQLK